MIPLGAKGYEVADLLLLSLYTHHKRERERERERERKDARKVMKLESLNVIDDREFYSD